MNETVCLVAVSITLMWAGAGCTDRRTTSSQDAQTNLTGRVFNATTIQTTEAALRAFSQFRYHSTMLEPAVGSQSIPGWQATNGFLLLSTTEPLSLVAVDRAGTRRLPYFADFHLTITHFESNRSIVTARTIRSRVVKGREINIHGGWAKRFRAFPPVREEEEKIISAIANELSPAQETNAPTRF